MRSNSTSPVHEWLEWGQHSLAAVVVGAVVATLVAFILIFFASRTEPANITTPWIIIIFLAILFFTVYFIVLRKPPK